MKLVVIVGKTATGKDTVARHLNSKYGIAPIVSYTTRPIRDCETDGIEHYFITTDEMEKLKEKPDQMLAYTKFPKTGYEYCASTSSLENDSVYSYILDPPGLEWMLKNRTDLDILVLPLNASELTIVEHAIVRGDDAQAIQDRIESEREIFNEFMKHADGVIDAEQTIEKVLECVDEKVDRWLNN